MGHCIRIFIKNPGSTYVAKNEDWNKRREGSRGITSTGIHIINIKISNRSNSANHT